MNLLKLKLTSQTHLAFLTRFTRRVFTTIVYRDIPSKFDVENPGDACLMSAFPRPPPDAAKTAEATCCCITDARVNKL